MPILAYTFGWMFYNSLLAVIPIVLALIFIKVENKFFKTVFFIAWLLFLPNTIYLLTDIIHLPRDLGNASGFEHIIVIAMYMTLFTIGIATYVLAIFPLEKIIKKYRQHKVLTLASLNFLIGIGLVLGRVFRFNSWDILIRPDEIFVTIAHILSSVQFMLVICAFSIFGTFIYLSISSSFKKSLTKFTQ